MKGTHPKTIPARFGLIWFRGFRAEDLNVKVYDGRTTTDAKWWQKLTWPLATCRWAKNIRKPWKTARGIDYTTDRLNILFIEGHMIVIWPTINDHHHIIYIWILPQKSWRLCQWYPQSSILLWEISSQEITVLILAYIIYFRCQGGNTSYLLVLVVIIKKLKLMAHVHVHVHFCIHNIYTEYMSLVTWINSFPLIFSWFINKNVSNN